MDNVRGLDGAREVEEAVVGAEGGRGLCRLIGRREAVLVGDAERLEGRAVGRLAGGEARNERNPEMGEEIGVVSGTEEADMWPFTVESPHC